MNDSGTLTNRYRRLLLLVVSLMLVSQAASARFLYQTRTEIKAIGGATTIGFDDGGVNDVRKMSDLLLLSDLQAGVPGYTGDEEVISSIDMRGLLVIAGFAEFSSELVLQVPALDLTLTFPDPGDRDSAIELLKLFLSGDLEFPPGPGGDPSDGPIDVSDLLEKMVEVSPVDPIAGNPNSLHSKMFYNDYRLGSEGPFRAASKKEREQLVRFGFDYNAFSGGPYSGSAYDFNIGYSVDLFTSKVALLLDLPVHLVDTQSAKTYGASGAAGLQFRPLDNWNITPIFRFGLAGSFELAGLGFIYGGSIVSHAVWDVRGFELGLINAIGGSASVPDVVISDVAIDYRLNTFNLRNGVDIARTFSVGWLGRPIRVSTQYALTDYFGNQLWLEHYHDVSVALALPGKSYHGTFDMLEVSLGYVGGGSYNSVQLRTGFRF